MKRLLLLSALGLALAAAVTTLYALGRAGLAAAERQRRAELRASRQARLRTAQEEIQAALDRLLEREGERPYFHYRHLYLPPELVANDAALVPSPLCEIPPTAAVGAYFEVRGSRLSSPCFLDEDLAGGEAPSDYAEEIRPRLLALRDLLGLPSPDLQVAQRRSEQSWGADLSRGSGLLARAQAEVPGPARVVRLDELVCQINGQPAEFLSELEAAQDDDQLRQSLNQRWTDYQSRQGKALPNDADDVPGGNSNRKFAPYQSPKDKSAKSQASQPARTIPVRSFPFRLLDLPPLQDGWPPELVALRVVELPGRSWLQGFLLERQHVEGVLVPEVLARLDPDLALVASEQAPSDESLPLSDPALSALSVAWAKPLGEDVDSSGALDPTRLLLDGSLALVVVVLLLGGWIVVRSAGEEARLAQRRADFVAAMTHELKAPLTGIRAMAELLEEGLVSDDERRQEYYGSILAESERLTRLVQNVLDAARLERGRVLSCDLQPLDLSALTAELVERFRPHLERQGFALTLALPADPVLAQADREATSQVLANLLDNAAKYGRGQSPALSVAVTADPPAVTVSDQGPGIPVSERDAVFERFVRGADAPREVGGAGLGLGIARAQARAQGGELSLRPSSQGASFVLSLSPAAAASPPESPAG